MADIEFYETWHKEPLLGENSLKTRERQAWLSQSLKDMNGPLLIVGCGSADEMSVAPNNAKAFGMDISFFAVQQSRSRRPQHHYVVADAAHPPFVTGGFDALVCSEVIEHVQQRDRALTEFHKLLATGGRLILSTPNWLSFYGLARTLGRLLLQQDFTSGDQPHDEWTTQRGLDAELQRAGFDPQAWFGLWFFPPFGKGRYRIPDCLIVPLLRYLMPLDRRLRSALPAFGHVIGVVSHAAPSTS